jgi:hypothetical protein
MENPLEGVAGYLKDLLEDIKKEYQKAFNIDTILAQMNEVDAAASKLSKQFGTGRENILNLNKSLTDSITQVTLLGGEFSDIAGIQEAISKDLGKNVTANAETVTSLFRTSEVVGQTTSTMVKNFKDVGIAADNIEKSMKGVVDQSRALGVNVQAVSKQVLDNMTSLNRVNFEGGVQGMAKMAAQAVSLRVSMKDSLDLAEKMFNPEQAIEMAAAMQRLGVAQGDLLDPLRLMELGQNDPAELQNQIAEMTKQFVQMGKDGNFEIMPGAKLRLQEIGKELQIPYQTLVNMGISGKELEDKMSKIKFTSDFNEEQQKFMASIAQMSGGEYKLKIDGEEFGMNEAMEEFRRSPEKLKELMDPKSMEDLAKEQLTTLKVISSNIKAGQQIGYATAGSGFGKDAFELLRTSANMRGEVFRQSLGTDTKTQSKVIDQVYGAFTGAFESLTGEGSFEEKIKSAAKKVEEAGNDLKTTIQNAGKPLAEVLQKEADNFKKYGGDMSKLIGNVYKIFSGEKETTKSVETAKTLEVKDGIDKVASVNKFEESRKNTEPLEFTIKIDHNISGTPAGMDTSQILETLKKAFPESEIQKVLEKAINDYNTSHGLIGKPK